ncbi:MAG: 2-amino-4-hydroxy-6-hydroxymethyldihydropteridine diphosphokinase [Urechidicola sp.]|jgi:2-amino-4-hydroxy-6-hydroxymethyldihydropteridine diphosphokinase|tara:strand:+ start:2249 stop:2767 length:519 start_codon:yes stop_codon:yes gene_type:complete
MNGNKHRVVLSFGGNLDNTLYCFEKATKKIKKKIGEVEITSSIYSTQAWKMEKDTPDFLNKVVVVLTDLKPKELLKATQKIEKKLGRKTKSINQEYKDRPIDIDLLFFDDRIIYKKKLVIPHQLLHTRKFILKPLSEIIPDYIHPVIKKTIKKLLLSCDDKLEVKKQHTEKE